MLNGRHHLHLYKDAREKESAKWRDFTFGHPIPMITNKELPNLPFPIQWNESINFDFDELAKIGAGAFYQNKISSERLASILEVRSMATTFPGFELRSFNEINGPLTDEIKTHFLKEKNFSQENWNQVLNTIEENEQFYAKLSVDLKNLSDERVVNLLFLAHTLNVIYIQDFNKVYNQYINYNQGIEELEFFIPSVSARTAFNNYIYGLDAKAILPGIGDFTMDDIERGMHNKGRYAVFSYPGIKDTPSFHEVKAPLFFMGLHDELHRRLVSGVPNSVYDIYLDAVQLVRDKTQIKWSTDIWNAIDLEVDNGFQDMSKEDRINPTPESITKSFEQLLNAKAYSTDTSFGLFSADNSCLDTLLILMIDLVNNKQKWLDKGVNPELFATEYYKNLYTNVSNTLENAIPGNFSLTQTIMCIKAKILEKETGEIDPKISFKEDFRFTLQNNYIQITQNNHIMGRSKAAEIALQEYNIAFNNLQRKITSLSTKIEKECEYKDLKDLNKAAQSVLDLLRINENDKIPLNEIQHRKKILEYTNRSLSDPHNKNLKKEYDVLITETKNGYPSLAKKILAALKGFASWLSNSEKSLQSHYNLFKTQSSTGNNKVMREFRNAAAAAPPSISPPPPSTKK